MTVYVFVDTDTGLEAAYNTETDSPDKVLHDLDFDQAADSIKDTIRNIVRHVRDGRDDRILDDLHWLNFEVYDQEHPEDLYCFDER
jgi:hypothetical protein